MEEKTEGAGSRPAVERLQADLELWTGLYFMSYAVLIVLFVVLYGPVVFYRNDAGAYARSGSMESWGDWGWIVGLMFFGALALIATHTKMSNVRLELLAAEAEEDLRPPVLLLRSFSQVGLYTHDTNADAAPEPGSRFNEIAKALETVGRPVVIGGGMALNAFADEEPAFLRLSAPDEYWRDVFRIFAAGARLIVIVPGSTEGVVEELQRLLQSGVRKKCIVLCLPTMRSGEHAQFRSHWDRIRATLQSSGLHLPPCPDNGLAYVPAPDLSVEQGVEISRLSQLADAIRPLIPEAEDAVPLATLLRRTVGESLAAMEGHPLLQTRPGD